MQSLRIRAEIEGGCGTAEPEVLVLPKDCATQKSAHAIFQDSPTVTSNPCQNGDQVRVY
jgi:hypothetical protein